MTTETTYRVDQLKKNIEEYLKTLDDDFIDTFDCSEYTMNSDILKKFADWLESKPPALGWCGYDSYGNIVFRKNPDSVDITRYNMREVMFKPEDTE